MTIRDLLAAESINLNGTPAGKTEALNQCIDLMAKSGKIADVETYRKGVFAREEEGTTGIGMGKSPLPSEFSVAFGMHDRGVQKIPGTAFKKNDGDLQWSAGGVCVHRFRKGLPHGREGFLSRL